MGFAMTARNVISNCSLTLHALFMALVGTMGCFPEDKPVLLPPPGQAQVMQITQGPDYERQYFFHFERGDTVGSDYHSWDLCFSTSDRHVWINGGNMALVARTSEQSLYQVRDTQQLQWQMDASSWHPDSTAIGSWWSHPQVYILDRGVRFAADQRWFKMKLAEVNGNTYRLQYALLHSNDSAEVLIVKDLRKHYVYFSFDKGEIPPFEEPDRDRWELLFTRYRHVFHNQEPPLPYVVTGVLLNPSVSVAIDSLYSFEEINDTIAQSLNYVARRDAIGFQWKYFDFSTQAFVVRPYVTYIVQDRKGVYWKMRFIDFYNDAGQKGYPTFEYQRL